MASIESQIYTSLASRLGLANLGYQIVFPNETQPSPLNMPYLKVDYLPNVTLRRQIESDGTDIHMGIFQVSVIAALRSSLTGPLDIAAQICDLYPADLLLVAGSANVQITKRPDVGPMLVVDDQVNVPVSIEYFCSA